VQKQIFGDAAVDETVDLGLEADAERPEAQGEAGRQRKAVSEQGAEESACVAVAFELAPRGGFHTIRTLTACGRWNRGGWV